MPDVHVSTPGQMHPDLKRKQQVYRPGRKCPEPEVKFVDVLRGVMHGEINDEEATKQLRAKL